MVLLHRTLTCWSTLTYSLLTEMKINVSKQKVKLTTFVIHFNRVRSLQEI